MFGDVIVPLDGTPESSRALGPAGALAHYLDSKVRVVAVDTDDEGPEFERRVAEQLRELGDVAREMVTVSGDVDVPSAVLEIVMADPGSLLVMASHGVDPADEAGGVAANVLRNTVLPVVLIGPAFAPSRFRCHGPLITAVTSDRHSHAILPVVEAFGIVFDFDVELVTVGDPDAPLETLADAAAEAIGSPVAIAHLDGTDPAEAIARRAEHTRAALVAAATHGADDDRSALLGSTTLALVRRAPCPVLAMRPATFAAE